MRIEILDYRMGDLVAQRRLVDALVEADALAVVLLVIARLRTAMLGFDAAHVDGDVFALSDQRHHRLDAGIARR